MCVCVFVWGRNSHTDIIVDSIYSILQGSGKADWLEKLK